MKLSFSLLPLATLFFLPALAENDIIVDGALWQQTYALSSCDSSNNETGTIDLGYKVDADSAWVLELSMDLASVVFVGDQPDRDASRYSSSDAMPVSGNISAYNRWGASILEANGKPSVLGNDYSGQAQKLWKMSFYTRMCPHSINTRKR